MEIFGDIEEEILNNTAMTLCFYFAHQGLTAVRALNGESEESMNTVIIETVVSIVSNLVITLIGVAGAWLVMQIGKHQELKTINAAVGELTTAAETTVQELNQTVVEGLKEVSADGKLTKDEIQHLGKLLLEGTMAKMSDAGINVLKAANVDINAIIVSAGEALIARIKQQKALAA